MRATHHDIVEEIESKWRESNVLQPAAAAVSASDQDSSNSHEVDLEGGTNEADIVRINNYVNDDPETDDNKNDDSHKCKQQYDDDDLVEIIWMRSRDNKAPSIAKTTNDAAIHDESKSQSYLDTAKTPGPGRTIVHGRSGNESDQVGRQQPPQGDQTSTVPLTDLARNRPSVIRTQVVPGAYPVRPQTPRGARNDTTTTTEAAVASSASSLPTIIRPVVQAPRAANNLGLVEANLVSEDEDEAVQPNSMNMAEALDLEELAKTQSKSHAKLQRDKHNCTKAATALIALSCVVIATAFGFAFGPKNDNDTIAPQDQPDITSTPSPDTVPPKVTVTFLEDLQQGLPNSSQTSLERITTPQWKGLDWLSRHPDLETMEEWRKRQLFALATFFFAFQGPHWRAEIRNDWMLYDKSECFWFSTMYGQFEAGEDGDSSTYDEGLERLVYLEPCNEKGEFQALVLDGLEIVGEAQQLPFVPPELALLTSLEYLAMRKHEVNLPLSQFLALEVYGMGNLTKLDLGKNQLHGPIPTELGLLTGMTDLHLPINGLDGPVPSELAQMTKLEQLGLYNNHALTGALPSELLGMTSIRSLELSNMSLSGLLPTEWGSLSALSHLDLSKNDYSGVIPSQLGYLANLSTLYLFGNRLSGSVPTDLARLSGLNYISLAQNDLSGTIPMEIPVSMTSLRFAWLNDNNLSGAIPTEFGDRSSSLWGMFMDNNLLSGTVPEGLCSLGPCIKHPIQHEHCLFGLSFDCGDQLCGCGICACN